MRDIAKAIHDGAMAFLNKEYRILSIFVIAFGFLLYCIVTAINKYLVFVWKRLFAPI